MIRETHLYDTFMSSGKIRRPPHIRYLYVAIPKVRTQKVAHCTCTHRLGEWYVLLTMVNGRVARTWHTLAEVISSTLSPSYQEKRKGAARTPTAVRTAASSSTVPDCSVPDTFQIDSQELFRVFPRTRMLRQVRGFVIPLLLFFVSHSHFLSPPEPWRRPVTKQLRQRASSSPQLGTSLAVSSWSSPSYCPSSRSC